MSNKLSIYFSGIALAGNPERYQGNEFQVADLPETLKYTKEINRPRKRISGGGPAGNPEIYQGNKYTKEMNFRWRTCRKP